MTEDLTDGTLQVFMVHIYAHKIVYLGVFKKLINLAYLNMIKIKLL